MKTIIDLGCGFNKLPPQKDEAKIITVDIRPETNPSVCCDVLKGVPLADKTADVIVASHFLEHFHEDSLNKVDDEMPILLNEVKRLLKDDGTFLVVVPSNLSYHAIRPNHKTVYSFNAWCSILVKNGFVISAYEGRGTWVEISQFVSFFEELAKKHPFFGCEYVIECKKAKQ